MIVEEEVPLDEFEDNGEEIVEKKQVKRFLIRKVNKTSWKAIPKMTFNINKNTITIHSLKPG